MITGLAEILAEFPGELLFREGLGGRELTTFGVGGIAHRGLIEVQSISGLRALKQFLSAGKFDSRLIGAGSNVVFPDSGLENLLLRLGKGLSGIYPHAGFGPNISELDAFLQEPSRELSQQTSAILVLGATSLMSLSRKVSQVGLSGLEFAAGIPGSLGGAIYMNAGAHGHSTEEVVSRVFLLSESGELLVKTKDELCFRYRHSELPKNAIVIGAELNLIPKDPKAVSEHRAACLDYRRRTQPLQLRSAGSVFRNPPNEAAGALLERAGLKGQRLGAIRYSELHANWLVAESLDDSPEGPGRAEDIRSLVSLGQQRVLQEYGISLEAEIVFW